MLNNKPLLKNVFILQLFFSVSSSYAASDSTVIDISHTYTPYINFTGSAAGASRFYDNSELSSGFTPIWVNLGTLGLESNVSGNCDLSFTTTNNFTLLNTTSAGSNLGGGSIGDYSLRFKNQVFGNSTTPSNLSLVLPCTNLATPIDFKLDRRFTFVSFDNAIRAGVYQDIVNIVVTIQ